MYPVESSPIKYGAVELALRKIFYSKDVGLRARVPIKPSDISVQIAPTRGVRELLCVNFV